MLLMNDLKSTRTLLAVITHDPGGLSECFGSEKTTCLRAEVLILESGQLCHMNLVIGCILFEHFMMICTLGASQITSLWVGNLSLESEETEGGTRVDSLKKPKKRSRIMTFSVLAFCISLTAQMESQLVDNYNTFDSE